MEGENAPPIGIIIAAWAALIAAVALACAPVFLALLVIFGSRA